VVSHIHCAALAFEEKVYNDCCTHFTHTYMLLDVIVITHNCIHIVPVIAVQVGLERDSYTVRENISDSDLALLLCAITSTDVQSGFTVTVSLRNGTAIGKILQCLD